MAEFARMIVPDPRERDPAEAALRRSERRFRELFDHTPDAIIVVTHDGIVQDANRAACRLYGLPHERLLGLQVADLVLSDRLALAPHDPSSPASEIDWIEGLGATADGRAVPIEIRISTIEHAGAPALLLHVRDVSERKRLETQLLQAQKMEGVGRLASGVAHDFNNLLTVISGYAGLALEELTSDNPLYSNLQEIQTVVERAARLTRQLLAFVRHQTIEPRRLNLSDLVLDLETLMWRLVGPDIDLVITPAPELAWIRADPGQIEQLLINLVVNARDAMPRGGKLRIETRNIESDDASVQQYLGAIGVGAVCLTVTDTGIGIDEMAKRHLFDLFYTTKAPGQGTGLGLTICYGIVKQHGGHIQVDSQVGQGTSFTIYLPQVADAAEVRPCPDTSHPQSCDTKTRQLAEGKSAVRKLATRLLHELGNSTRKWSIAWRRSGWLRRIRGDDTP
jgi:PAS domain S-box-containing protein